jgi:hypothetical protein
MDAKKVISFLLACVMSVGMAMPASASLGKIKVFCKLCPTQSTEILHLVKTNKYSVKDIYGVDSIGGYTTAYLEVHSENRYWVGDSSDITKFICPEHVAQLLAEMGEVSAVQTVNTTTGAADVPITVTRDAPTFSVTVPTSMPISIGADGKVTTAGNVAIENNSSRSVCVKSVVINAASDWTLAKFDKAAMRNEAIDSKKLGFSMTMGTKTAATTKDGQTETIGSYTASDVTIDTGSQLPITYDGTIPAQVSGIAADTQAASVVFTVDWAA